MCARRADGERVHDKELIKPPCPLRAQRFDGMKHTPRVVIPPHRNVGIALCEGRKNPLKASRRNILFLCCRWQIPPRILLFPIGAEISFYGSFYHRPQQGSRRNPAKRFRWEEDERQRERVLPLAAGRGIRRPLGRRRRRATAGDGQHRICLVCGEAAALPNALGGGMAPHPQAAGRSPHPLLATIGEKHEKRYQIQHAHGVR